MADWQALFPVLKNIFFFQLFCTACLLLLLFKYPVVIFRIWQRYLIFKTGFTVRKCRVADNYEFEYIERGSKDEQKVSVLLLHGFASSKDTWCKMASYIPKRIHVVAVDLPGHGGTTRKEKDDISVPGLAKRVEQFAEAIGLNKKKYHLVGTSLGASIAGVQSALFPDNILSTVLVCPGGVNAPVKSEFVLLYENEGRTKLLPQNEEEMQELMSLLLHKRKKIPKVIMSGIIQARKPADSFFEKLLEEVLSDSNKYDFEEHLEQIKTKVLVVWGKHDKAFDVSSVKVIEKKLPNCKIEILEDCGHSIHMEKPYNEANIITKFIDEGQITT